MQLVDVRGVRLAVSTFGARTDPPVLLVAGVGCSMDWWEPDFCAALADAGRYVVRYDHRDTGESVSYPPGAPGYRSEDLVEDPVAVLAALGVSPAHLVGISMGGGLTQLLALAHPEAVRTLTLISTSGGAGDPDLPPMGAFEPPPEPDWSDRAAVLDYHVESQRPYAAATRPFDAEAFRAVAALAHDRTTNPESAAKNHYLAEGGGPWRSRLPEVTAPTLVLHGTEDPMFPPAHGEALAREIPNARLVPMPGVGHELTRPDWPLVLRELVAHTS
ncbi:alpha/beta fold hydrolase [Actinophytocola gossypii]|uniref:Alpha/beta hydrolase n=1 Tax=Actinophytocola gossypii TaxID=2812003 RepID=A0ABT2J4M9_9PSEU|nr:alpha/beta hydrolase [Actinophytocola gossypii]MCT2582822.1 alpha/beta hydrolase [Actinophytocola gossypii]